VPNAAFSPAVRRRDVTREAILAAALRCFGRNGYRRTALDRVAHEAGISRAALYLHFANKEELFRALVTDLHARALDGATRAAHADGDVTERLTAVLLAKTARFFELLRASEHAEEFLDENHRQCGAISAAYAAKHARLLSRMIARAAAAGTLALPTPSPSATQIADLLLDTVEGIKARNHPTLSARAYEQRVGQAVRLICAGLAQR
jgi:AcrR family transcriptional regulator